MRIGFLGAGLMGAGMAANLARQHAVSTVLHRNRAPEARLRSAGVAIRATREEVVRDAQVLFLCLPNADVVGEVIGAVRPLLRPGTMIVDTTTSLPSATRRLAATLAADGIAYIDAPITGGPDQADAGELVAMVGASEPDFERARPLLSLITKKIIRFGEPGAGHTAKLINNFITQGQAALTIEAMRRCAAVGIDMHDMYDLISSSGSRSGTFMKIMPSVIEGTYDGHRFSVANAAKDVRYARAMFEDAGEPSRLVEGMTAFFEAELGERAPDTFLSELMRPLPDPR